MFSIRRDDYFIDTYNSISEVYNDLKDKKPRDGAEDSSESGSYGFTETYSLEEAFDLMIRGDEKIYKKITDAVKKIDITKILGNVIKKNSNYNDIVGYQANVPNYLKGIPTDMINVNPTRKSQKIINIIVNGSVSAMMDTEDIIKISSYYYLVIDLLEKSGYRCNVYVMSNFSEEDDGYILVRAKVDREPFNKYKMAFLLVNPSFHRRIGFKWIECCNCKGEPTDCGYGKPITDVDKIKDIFDKEMKCNFIVWSLQKDFQLKVEDIIERLKKDGIKIGDEINEK